MEMAVLLASTESWFHAPWMSLYSAEGECYSLLIRTRTNSTFYFKLFDSAGLARVLQSPWRARVTRVQISSASRQWPWPLEKGFSVHLLPVLEYKKREVHMLWAIIIIHMTLLKGSVKNKLFLGKFYSSTWLKERWTTDLIFWIKEKWEVEWYWTGKVNHQYCGLI